MAATVVIAGYTGSTNVGASTTTYGPIANASAEPLGTESLLQVRWQSAGTFSKLTVAVSANDRGASTVRVRKNTANGSGLVSIGASLTGAFQDTSGSDTIASGDVMAYQLVTGSGGTVFSLASVGAAFTATTNTIARFQCTRESSFASGAGNRTLSGERSGTTAHDESRIQSAGSFKHIAAVVTFNNRTGATAIGVAVNSVDSSLSASAPASTTGTFTDNTNSAAVVANDLVRFTYSSGTSGSIQLDVISVDFETTGRNSLLVSHGQPSAVLAGQTRYGSPTGTLVGLQTVSSEVLSQVAMPDAGSMISMSVYASANSASGSTVVTIRKAAVNSSVAVSIPTLSTGWFAGTGSVSVSALDLVSLGVVVAAGTGEISLRDASVGWLAPSSGLAGSFVIGKDGTVTSTRTGLINLDNVTRTVTGPGVEFIGAALGMIEQATAPTAVANTGMLYAEDNGSGKTRLVVKFGTGTAIVIATEA